MAPDDLELTSLKRVKGQQIKRTVKAAYKGVSRTLSLAPQVISQWVQKRLGSPEYKVGGVAPGRYQFTL